ATGFDSVRSGNASGANMRLIARASNPICNELHQRVRIGEAGGRTPAERRHRMHIPDGYLSPQTEAVFAAAMVPVYVAAARSVRRIVKSRYVPLLAIAAAFSFLVMMLNVPIPGGTTAHAIGGVLIAVIL